jgi:hypothetical protein
LHDIERLGEAAPHALDLPVELERGERRTHPARAAREVARVDTCEQHRPVTTGCKGWGGPERGLADTALRPPEGRDDPAPRTDAVRRRGEGLLHRLPS